MFLPTTLDEARARGWERLDVVLVGGDAYVDSPFIGIAVIGRVLEAAGFRVGIIAQPDPAGDDVASLGEPELFWGVSGGSIDSMVANRTASGKRRHGDDYTPGGRNDRRPDRAVIVYANLIRAHFKNTRPIVLGGIEASLRRIAHYDFWTDRVRRSILLDAKADFLLYGMAENTVVELAERLRDGRSPGQVRGLCHLDANMLRDAVALPPFEEVQQDRAAFIRMFETFYHNNDPLRGRTLVQAHGGRFLVHNPPPPPLSTEQLDRVHALPFTRDIHPACRVRGEVKALATIRFAIPSHRGCYGECNFCAIAAHQGRAVTWRSPDSIVAEARRIAAHPAFKGIIPDLGGPTANMYGFECAKKFAKGACEDRRCLHPKPCPSLGIDHGPQIELLRRLRQVKGIRKVVVASGIRHDLILADRAHGLDYLRELIRHHLSGQMKLAPEHSEEEVLERMGKPGRVGLLAFREIFLRLVREDGKEQFLTYYLIAGHPGCTQEDMRALRRFCDSELRIRPRQVQVFTPTPSTWSTCMYWTEHDPFAGGPCFVEKTFSGREMQKMTVVGAPAKNTRDERRTAGQGQGGRRGKTKG